MKKVRFKVLCEKNGWKILVIEYGDERVKQILYLTDTEALELYKFVGENFDVESLDG